MPMQVLGLPTVHSARAVPTGRSACF
jgi:hypothetical protein